MINFCAFLVQTPYLYTRTRARTRVKRAYLGGNRCFFVEKQRNICVSQKKVVTLRDFIRFCIYIGIIIDIENAT